MVVKRVWTRKGGISTKCHPIVCVLMQPWHLDVNRKVVNICCWEHAFMISGKDGTVCWAKDDLRNAVRNKATNPPLDQKCATIF